MKTALVIMAAGMGSRFGGGIKQLEPVGPNGEIILSMMQLKPDLIKLYLSSVRILRKHFMTRSESVSKGSVIG